MKQNRLKSSQKRICKNIKHKKVYCDSVKRKTSKDEYGLFAKRDIAKGETVFIAKGNLVQMKIESANDSAKYPNAIGIDKNTWLDPQPNNPLVYLNHSCSPNVGIRGNVTFTAIKPIKKDEEITLDYSITEQDRFWRLDAMCYCGSDNCRKVIRSIQHLPVTLYKKYLPYVSKKMQKAFEDAQKN